MKILVVACYSPIINNSASIETLMYLNNLVSNGENEVHLLTVDFPENSIYYDKEILQLLDEHIELHKIDGGRIFNKIMPKKIINDSKDKEKVNTSKKFQILRKIKNKIIFPDMYYIWSKAAAKYANEKLMNEGKPFDVIFSMHEPPSSHLCAKNIKLKNQGIPWITYWSDPWLSDPSRSDIGIIRKTIEGRMEKSVVMNCDKLIFVTEANKNDFKKRYNLKNKYLFLINRGYDQKLYKQLEQEEKPKEIDKNKINIIYAGEIFSKLRDISKFIEALDKLKNDNKEVYNSFNIMFYGNIDDASLCEKLKSFDNVKVNKRISFRQALKLMIHSEVLLLFGNKNSKQIPAKIYDYFGCKGKVLVVLGDENDPIKSVVKNKDKCITISNSSEAIFDSLIDIYMKNQNNELIDMPLEEYEWGAVTRKMESIFKGM